MATLKEVARAAGVSVDTVSRVLNRKNKEKWSSTARRSDEIRRIAASLGFRPNAAARAVRRGTFHRIAFVVTCFEFEGRPEMFQGRGYFPAAIHHLAELGYSVIPVPIFQDIKTLRMKSIPHLFAETAVDGILALDGSGIVPSAMDEFIADLGVPTVWLNRSPVPGLPCITSDEVVGGRTLVRHLVDHGHRRIGYVGLSHSHYSWVDRARSVHMELEAAGLDASGIVRLRPQHWGEDIEELLDRPDRPTGLISCMMPTFHAVHHVLSRRGWRIPEDISLACFSSAGEWSKDFPFTTWRVPETEMAEKGVELLMDLVAGKPVPNAEYKIQGRLIL